MFTLLLAYSFVQPFLAVHKHSVFHILWRN
jgi:hypothetical protein